MKSTTVALVRLISSPYYSPTVTIDVMERLYVYRGVKLELEIDLSLDPSYYCLEYEETGVKRRAYFPYWYDVEVAINDLLSGRVRDEDIAPWIRENNEFGDAVNV